MPDEVAGKSDVLSVAAKMDVVSIFPHHSHYFSSASRSCFKHLRVTMLESLEKTLFVLFAIVQKEVKGQVTLAKKAKKSIVEM